ncbi:MULTISPECIES: hypothetical protein [unclassified Streptomyces]|uniref:hypothetical protein n=1 Tax=unclassified Streptomyces TaxID=2593676 RepID=UPI000A5ABABF|nr:MULTISPECIES: hypothetical protein [unclassified Streptomyces]
MLRTALADGRVLLDVGTDRGAAERVLAALSAGGPRAAAYVRMRVADRRGCGGGGAGEGPGAGRARVRAG